ncbi:type II secretion system ATPase GspE [Arenibaculum sp.]|jgi:general secretion pathway protein E|uniref:type II secretion system ATPase GspE n=1 Tax=Arenibaculum sp. TaxID=2865862 RepID=UPI002E149501|nr:type II secretion system ATPase GspE [Arenibaculum sp.]
MDDVVANRPSPRRRIERIAACDEERASFERAFVDRLIASGSTLDRNDLDRIRRTKDATERLDGLVLKLGLVSEAEAVDALCAVLDLPKSELDGDPVEAVVEGRLPLKFLREARVLPLRGLGGDIALAMADPLDTFAVEAVEYVLGEPVIPCVAMPSALDATLERLGDRGRASMSDIVEDIGTAENGMDLDGAEDVERLKDLASEAPVVRLVNLLIGRAVEERASDIHIESFEGTLRVRYRVDGVLRPVEAPPSRLRAAIISRIKIMARLDIAERRLPQDGRVKLSLRGRDVDLRVATAPTLHGENVVLRILDRSGVVLDLPRLGFEGRALEEFAASIERPHGVILITGPTGSGKTTTLYASLLRLNAPEKKIVTVEDPIEYQVDGVNQIQVKPQIDLTFATVLRSVLRQDPDIIMIGEIRDQETAKIAVQAALTGHLVVSTLHTNGAAAAIARLIDMEVEDYLLASTLAGVLAQRLVRTLCPACKRPHARLPETARHLGVERFADGPPILHQAVGCEHCNGTGYRGRLAILEFLPVSENVARLILDRVDARRIHDAAVTAGMRTLFEDGVRKALAGLTSLEEVLRVARET